MKRTRWAWMVAVALMLVAVGVWWSARQPSPAPPGDSPAPQPPLAGDPALGGIPDRPPEFYGVVERLIPGQPDGRQAFFVRSIQPPAGVPESPQNAWERRFPPPHVNGVGVPDANARLRAGGPARVAVGQTVSAWCSGPVAMSYPAGWSADLVIVESGGG